MKKRLVIVIGAAAGLALGLVAFKLLRNKKNDIPEEVETPEEISNLYANSCSYEGEKIEENSSIDKSIDCEEKVFRKSQKRPLTDYRNASKYNNKKAMIDMAEEELEDEDDMIDEISNETYSETPRSVDRNELEQSLPQYDLIDLIFYEGDSILATEEGEDLSNDILETVGTDYMDAIDEYEPGWGFVINDSMGAKYRIQVVPGYFEDTIN